MNKIAIAAACLISLIPLNSFAVNFKKTFCGSQEFLGNPATKRPHLHCKKTFISYKKVSGDHLNISEQGDCKRTDLVFDDIKANRNVFSDYPAIYRALVLYHKAGC